MYRIILFLLLIALAATGAAWVADQPGDVVLSWSNLRVHATLPVFALALGITIVAAMVAWSMLGFLWRLPEEMRKARRERRHARGRNAITQGLLAIGNGDSAPCRGRSADAAVARPVRAARRQSRCGARGVPGDGGARGHEVAGPARIVHRGAARRRCGCGRGDCRRGAENLAVIDLGLAGGARFPLRQRRLDGRARHPRQQSRLRPDRQADLPAPARRAADGARAGARDGGSRSVA